MKRNNRRWSTGVTTGSVAVAVMAVMVMGATGVASTSAPGDVVTLRIGTNDGDDAAAAAAIGEFARQVDEISDGAIRIEPVFHAGGEEQHTDWDQVVARLVVGGDLDMGMIPARAWDTEGVRTLRPLVAPFLVDSDELMTTVASKLAPDLLAGLDDVGVTGLALVPESLRHVFAFGDPLVTPDDFAGALIRVPHSATTWALFDALGATPADLVGDDLASAVSSGELDGAETSYARAFTLSPGGTVTVTANATPYPNINALVINSAVFQDLTAGQQDLLRQAATSTGDVIGASIDDASAAADFCAAGGLMATAPADALAALAAAAQPVYEMLGTDPATAVLIDRIDGLKANIDDGDDTPTCGAVTGSVADATVDGATADTIPPGDYRRTVTRDAAVAAGFDPALVDDILGADGELTIVFHVGDGRWTETNQYPDHSEVGDGGTYTYDTGGRLVTTSESGGCHGCVGVIDWTLEDGVLTLTLASGVEHPGPYEDDERLITDGQYTQDTAP